MNEKGPWNSALESSPPLPSLYVASCPVDKDSEVFQDVVPSEAESLSRHKVFEHFQGTWSVLPMKQWTTVFIGQKCVKQKSLHDTVTLVAGKNLGPLAAHREKDCNHSSNGCNPITTAWPLYGHPRRHTCMSAKKTPNFNCQGWDTFVIQPCQLKSNTSAKIQVAIQSPQPGRTHLSCGKFGIFQPPILKSKCWHSVGRSSCWGRMTFPYCPYPALDIAASESEGTTSWYTSSQCLS